MGNDPLKKIDILFLVIVIIVSVSLSTFLEGKLPNGYIVLMVIGFAMVMVLLRRFILNNDNK